MRKTLEDLLRDGKSDMMKGFIVFVPTINSDGDLLLRFNTNAREVFMLKGNRATEVYPIEKGCLERARAELGDAP